MRKQVVFSHLSGLAFICLLGGLVFAAPTVSYAECDNIPQLQKKARAGNAEAQVDLGMCCLHGRGVTMDLGQATKLFRRAAEQGNARGQVQLGLVYSTGIIGSGVTPNERRAVEWFRKAAEQGNADGQFLLGMRYYYGRGGLPMSRQKAVDWWRKAAAQGDVGAKEQLREIGEH